MGFFMVILGVQSTQKQGCKNGIPSGKNTKSELDRSTIL
jgi:hypothetical protein